MWLDEPLQIAVTVQHAGASGEQLLVALEKAAARLRAQLALYESKAA